MKKVTFSFSFVQGVRLVSSELMKFDHPKYVELGNYVQLSWREHTMQNTHMLPAISYVKCSLPLVIDLLIHVQMVGYVLRVNDSK